MKGRTTPNVLHWVSGGIHVAMMCGAVAAVFYGDSFTMLPDEYRLHVAVVAALALALGVVSRLWKHPIPLATALVCSLALWYMVAYPEARTIYAQVMAATALLIGVWSFAGTVVAGVVTLAWIALALTLPAGGVAWGTIVPDRSSVAYLASLGIPLIAGLLVWLVRSLRRHAEEAKQAQAQMREALDHLSSANLGFQQMVRGLAERTKQEERDRITRDIHDSIGYTVSNVIVMLDAAAGLIHKDPDRAVEILTTARQQANRGHEETRRTLHILRSLEEAEIYGIRNLKRIADLFTEATGACVEVDFGNIRPKYDGMIESAVYRFVQEGMTNAFRHGNATKIEVSMFHGNGRLVVTVVDNGSGAAEIAEGIGILGMRERMSQVGGEISFENGERGFRVTARIPLPKNEVSMGA